MFPVCFKLFPILLLDCAVFSTSTFVTLRFHLFTESQEEWNISHLCFIGIITDIQFYTLQLVEVSTVFVFLGRGLLVKDTDSQEDQYLFKISPCEHSEQIYQQIAISCVSSFSSHLTACLSYNLLICCIYLDEAC